MSIKIEFNISPAFLNSFSLGTSKAFIAGAELEIEAVRDYSHNYVEDNQILVEVDGSLRNGGREFILPPSKKGDLVDLFEGVHSRIELGNNPFSIRTSVHVHVNCMQSSGQQVLNLLYLYSIFEPLAFSYVGEERKNNIHCMPLWSTHMPTNYGVSITSLVERWHKYTAFNLLPLRELGTVEFRHLGGTDDVERFLTWLNFIEVLWNNAHSMGTFNREKFNNLTWLREIQEQLLTPAFLSNCNEFPSFNLEDNLLDVKLAFI